MLPFTLTRPKALQPRSQRIRKILPADLAAHKIGSEIKAVLRVLERISENPLRAAALAALWGFLECLDLGCKWLRGQGGKGAPGVVFAPAPVDLRGPDVPAAEFLVCEIDEGPFGEEGARGRWELAVADVALVAEGVVFREELVWAQVCGLEVAFVCRLAHDIPTKRREERKDLPHCVQYCHVHAIMDGSVNWRSRSQFPSTVALPEQLVSR